ncbi:leukemia inhibitory factor-like [Emydura macquarii macquarii]|uniref:leukemia inhibitory factor-like n=1 Tax=Emydura macquarii macquarii TaxID=1129001 RepID=UPI00352B0AF7
MEKEAKNLFQSYLVHQGLHLSKLGCRCYEPVKWFPMGNVTAQPMAVTLQELYRTMAHMRDALQTIRKQQQVLNAPDAALHSELQSAQWAVGGLLSNIGCALCLQGTSPTPRATPERPATTNAFQQKLEGCKVLWNYSEFLQALVQGSVRKEQQAGRDKRKRQKGIKRKQASRS